MQAMRDAWQNPDAILAALAAYEHSEAPLAPEQTAEIDAILVALEELKAEEQATAQAQVAGIRSGASADVYAGMFADIAVRRKDLNFRRTQLERRSHISAS